MDSCYLLSAFAGTRLVGMGRSWIATFAPHHHPDCFVVALLAMTISNRVIPAEAGINHQAQFKTLIAYLYTYGSLDYCHP